MHSEVCKLLNVSFNEIYTTWDLPFYHRVKKLMNEDAERKKRILDDAARSTKDKELKRKIDLEERQYERRKGKS